MSMDFRIDGVMKTLDKGYVKVDGALKQIDKIWTKIDGVVREVYSSFPFDIIAGDINYGYGGKRTGLIDQATLESLTGFALGTSRNVGDITWLQFAYQGKALYIADRTLRYEVYWSNINDSGIALGKNITIGGKQYKCRLMTGGADEVTDSQGYNDGGTRPNEWDNLIRTFTPDTNDSHWNPNDPVVSYSGQYTICQELYNNQTGMTIYRGGNSLVTWNYQSYPSGSYYGWRPVLELIQ